MILPKDYENLYPCINECGKASKIYVNLEHSKAYKIYRNIFKYDKEKFEELLSLFNPNCISPTDTISMENNPNLYIGYEMNFDTGIALSKISNTDLDDLIIASLAIPETLTEISNHHFLITDPNVDNIIFSSAFKFVDTYSFLLAKKFTKELIYQRNITKINDTVLCGLIDLSYKKIIESFLVNIDSKYLELFLNLVKHDLSNINYIHDILSIIQETTQEDELKNAKQKILSRGAIK